MKGKGKAVGLFCSAVAFAVAGIATAVTGGIPEWVYIALNAGSALAGALGITFVLPVKKE